MVYFPTQLEFLDHFVTYNVCCMSIFLSQDAYKSPTLYVFECADFAVRHEATTYKVDSKSFFFNCIMIKEAMYAKQFTFKFSDNKIYK